MKTHLLIVISLFIFVFVSCNKEKNVTPNLSTSGHLKSAGDGVIANYPFNGGAQDMGPYAQNGVVYNATLTADRRGNAISAYQFNGSNAYISVPAFGNIIPRSEISVSMWARTNVSKSAITLNLGDDNCRFGISIDYNHNGENSIFWDFGWQGDGGDAPGRLYQIGTSFDQSWHHYVFISSINESMMKIYKDGILIAEKSDPLTMDAATALEMTIGKGINDIYYQGAIDDIRIFNYPIGETAISDLYHGLVANYPFSNGAQDIGPFTKDGIVYNANLTTDRKGNANSAYYFNGTNAYIQATGFGNILPPKEISVSVWTATTVSKSCIAVNLGTNPRFGASIDYSHNGVNSIFWDYGWTGSSNGRLYVIGAPFDQNWHHYVLISSITQNSMKIYKDGSLLTQKTGAAGMGIPIGLDLFLGKGSNNIYYNGIMDDIKIFEYPLSAAEVLSLYNE